MENTERDAEAHIQALIERWENAVQQQDLEKIVADHATDFLMFDVPPPNELTGIEAYRVAGVRSSSTSSRAAFSRSSG
jgi:ketosteroid isomerase-like protein